MPEYQAYDVVLMDTQMPEMDGREATRRICHRWPVGERLHIIAMTADAMAEHREQCIAASMDDYQTGAYLKPVCGARKLGNAQNRIHTGD